MKSPRVRAREKRRRHSRIGTTPIESTACENRVMSNSSKGGAPSRYSSSARQEPSVLKTIQNGPDRVRIVQKGSIRLKESTTRRLSATPRRACHQRDRSATSVLIA